MASHDETVSRDRVTEILARARQDGWRSMFAVLEHQEPVLAAYALATADLSRAELLHPIDGWHASVKGHNVLAEAAFSDLKPSLDFLGIG